MASGYLIGQCNPRGMPPLQDTHERYPRTDALWLPLPSKDVTHYILPTLSSISRGFLYFLVPVFSQLLQHPAMVDLPSTQLLQHGRHQLPQPLLDNFIAECCHRDTFQGMAFPHPSYGFGVQSEAPLCERISLVPPGGILRASSAVAPEQLLHYLVRPLQEVWISALGQKTSSLGVLSQP